ncbi:competence/damage-inducible protein-like protein cinA [Pseudovirgaria hyperparasitica]|uniref:Competence/damage-inducible protein-like protein cinA n=1 Tax=Pseudovirgaria hyperparasitica TaxID=470096 RepID=A0A6A6WAP0_9PEZI|nr:competence/damage-inducible protein-like protein cinA [Pseudovirgaria hyperparasitica]KAF2759922.1 competence/damage-inducible protein-like protein cinA [Pseudovirgaria hyperparasitica]
MSSFVPHELREQVTAISKLLKDKGETISVAETAAGGLISASLLSIPGASKFYKGGVTLYTLPSRIAYAGWTESDIKTYNGPTPALVAGLAEHTRVKLGSTVCVAESGTAGPEGSGRGSNRQPGYVAVAVAVVDGETVSREVCTGVVDREGNMVRFAVEALGLVREVLEGRSGGGDGRL